MIIPIVSYNNILDSAKGFYKNGIDGNYKEADECLDKYFKQSRMINPSVARMSLQHAQNDIMLEQALLHRSGTINTKEYCKRNRDLGSIIRRLNHDSRLSELTKRIKETFPKTYNKKMSIIPFLIEGDFLKYANVNQLKFKKKMTYFFRKYIARL